MSNFDIKKYIYHRKLYFKEKLLRVRAEFIDRFEALEIYSLNNDISLTPKRIVFLRLEHEMLLALRVYQNTLKDYEIWKMNIADDIKEEFHL